VKLTVQRRAVLEVLEAATDHPDIAEIHRRARERHPLALATIYRVVRCLVDARVAVHHQFGDRAGYELAGRSHYHLVDRRTGHLAEVEDEILTAFLARSLVKRGYRLLDYKLQVTAEPDE